MKVENSLSIVEFRNYILSNLENYTLENIRKRLKSEEEKLKKIEVNYNKNNELYENELFNQSCKVATYKMALDKKSKYEPIELKLSDDGMQYKLF